MTIMVVYRRFFIPGNAQEFNMYELKFVTNRFSQAKTINHGGKDWLVAPLVLVQEGILNGEFVPADEISAFVEAWNGIPLPLGHPMDEDGNPVSANSPELEAVNPGRLWNARFEDGKLKAEAWIDIAKAQGIGGDAARLLQLIQSNQQIEVSSAYFREVFQESGTFEGQQYSGISRNIRPDHAAILLDEIGACSLQDGCGLLVNQCDCEKCRQAARNESSEVIMNEDVEVQEVAEQPTEPIEDKETQQEVKPKSVVTNDEAGPDRDDDLDVIVSALSANTTRLEQITKLFEPLGGIDGAVEVLLMAKDNFEAMAHNAKKRKEQLVSNILSNQGPDSPFSEDELMSNTIEFLEKLENASRPKAVYDFTGRGVAINSERDQSDWVQYVSPTEEVKNG